MSAQLIPVLTFLAVLGSGLMAGLFFAFSNSVMRGLASTPAAQGMATMNAINVVIQNPLFLAIFMGTAVLSVVLILAVLFGAGSPRPVFLSIGAVLYVVGVFGVTIVVNVPMNNALAAANPESPAGAALWATYLDRWVFWNHIRSGASAASFASLAWAVAA